MRANLDPFNDYTDEHLWAILEQCSIDKIVRDHPDRLKRPIETGGTNVSVGERQLLCMARAVIKGCRILVADEATASIDMETDAIIQQTLRERLRHATTLTIAHRLNTIFSSDVIIVMHEGKVAEMGSPDSLRSTAGSKFASMCSSPTEES